MEYQIIDFRTLTRQKTKDNGEVLFIAIFIHDGKADDTKKMFDLRILIGKNENLYYLE